MTEREALKLALEHIEGNYTVSDKEAITAIKEALAQPEQEPVERGSLRFYTNGIERQHWKADGSIDFKDEQGNVTMTLASGEIKAPIHFCAQSRRKPLTLNWEPIQEFWRNNSNLDWGELETAINAAAHGIKE